MASNLINMFVSWVGLFALFAALAAANPVKHGNALFELSLNHLRVDNGLVPKGNLSVAAPGMLPFLITLHMPTLPSSEPREN